MDIYIVGAGGFAREVLDVVDALGSEFTVAGVVADGGGDLAQLADRGVPFLGGIDNLPPAKSKARYVIAIGNGQVRKSISMRLDSVGWLAATLVHPHATIGSDVRIGKGSIICAGARLTTNIELGLHCHINLNSTVGHDVRIGSFTTLNPLVSVSGRASIGTCVTVGTGANIIERLAVADGATIGAGAVVVRDVHPANAVYAGVPARRLDKES